MGKPLHFRLAIGPAWRAFPWAELGALGLVLLSLTAGALSLIWRAAPVPSSAITAGRTIQAAAADARLWTAARGIITWSAPLVAVALLAWIATVEFLRRPASNPLAQARAARRAWLALGLVLTLHIVNNLIWLKVDHRPPYWDMASHLTTSLDFLRADGLAGLAQAIGNVNHYPPLYYLATLPLYWTLGPSEDVASLVNLASLALLMAATYGIGAYFWDRATGVLGAFLVSMYPFVVGLLHKYLIDITLTALVAASVWACVKSEGFRHRRYVLLLGVLAALGMLTKRAFALYLAGPVLWVGWQMLRGRANKRTLLNLAGVGLLVLLIAAPWYLLRGADVVKYALDRIMISGDTGRLSLIGVWRSWVFYLRTMVGEGVQLPFALLFVFGLGAIAWRRDRGSALLLAWLIGAIALLSPFGTRDARFLLPAYPAMALISAAGIMSLRRAVWRWALLSVASGAAILYMVVVSYGIAALPAPVELAREASWTSPAATVTLYSERAYISLPAQPWEWQIEQILDGIAAGGKAGAIVGVVPNRAAFEAGAFSYYAELAGLEVSIISVGNSKDYAALLGRCDYVVTLVGDPGRPDLNRYTDQATQAVADSASPPRATFRLMHEYELPDRSIAQLYERARE